MKSLKDYSNEINKCSKCGLCQAVCPVYKLTGNECAVSKGKFVMLNGVIKGDLKLNKTINKYIEMCLLCGKCNDFCPSEIDVCEIFQTAKSEYLNNSLKKRFVHWIESEQVFDKSLNFIETMLNLRIQNSHDKTKPEILFFKGCANKINPSNEQIIRKILKTSGYNLSDADFKCCGVPFASDGNLKRYEEVVKYNMRIINSSNCEYVLTDCASCEDTLKNYPNLNKQIINIGEFCARKNIKFEFPKKYIVTFHKPCHLKNDAFVNKLLKNCKNIEYIEMEDYDDCCGFAGKFAFTNPKLSKEISKIKIKKALSVNPDIILTTCPACILGLKQGLFYNGKIFNAPKILSITDFLKLGKITNPQM